MDLCVFSTLCFLDLLMDLSVTSYSQFLVCANIFLSFDPKPKMYSFCSLWINLCLDIVCSLLKTVG